MTIACVRLRSGSIDVTAEEGDLVIKAERGGCERRFRIKGVSRDSYRRGVRRARKWVEEGR